MEVWSLKGLIPFYVLFVIDLPSSGFLRDKENPIVNRDTYYSAAVPSGARAGTYRGHPPTPSFVKMSVYAERFDRSIKDEWLSMHTSIGPRMLCRALHEYTEHHDLERNHKYFGGQPIVRWSFSGISASQPLPGVASATT